MLYSPLTLVPAYGRSYSTVGAMRIDWLNGRSFKIYPNGPYCSIRDLVKGLADEYSSLWIIDPRTGVRLEL